LREKCLARQYNAKVSKSVSEDIAAEIQREAAQQGASSLEGLQTIARRVTDRRNSAPLRIFMGCRLPKW
jgi:hypothetical protein